MFDQERGRGGHADAESEGALRDARPVPAGEGARVGPKAGSSAKNTFIQEKSEMPKKSFSMKKIIKTKLVPMQLALPGIAHSHEEEAEGDQDEQDAS